MYYVSEPCTYAQDGRIIIHRKAGAVVELSDELAAELGDKVRRVGDPDVEQPDVPMGAPAVIVEPVVEPVVAEVPTSTFEPTVDEPPAADPVAARRARRSSDG